jgi:hypothetical protein
VHAAAVVAAPELPSNQQSRKSVLVPSPGISVVNDPSVRSLGDMQVGSNPSISPLPSLSMQSEHSVGRNADGFLDVAIGVAVG